MDDETCRNALIGLETAPARFAQPDSVLQPRISLLNTVRPNILLVLLESFSGSACHAIAPEADPAIMPCINALYGSSVSFSRFYANSFRTDRGMAAVMAAYPSQPCYTIMNNPDNYPIMPGTGGLRKARIALDNKGKSGGARVCFVDFIFAETIYLITVYGKKEKTNLTKEERNEVKKAIDLLKKSLGGKS